MREQISPAYLQIWGGFFPDQLTSAPVAPAPLAGTTIPIGDSVATVIPVILVVAVKDVAGLADLYAVGVVGAIATNLGATSTDKKLHLGRWERSLMFCTFLIMAALCVIYMLVTLVLPVRTYSPRILLAKK